VPAKGIPGPNNAGEGEIIKAQPPVIPGITFHAPPPGFDLSTLDFSSNKVTVPGPSKEVPFEQYLKNLGLTLPNPEIKTT